MSKNVDYAKKFKYSVLQRLELSMNDNSFREVKYIKNHYIISMDLKNNKSVNKNLINHKPISK